MLLMLSSLNILIDFLLRNRAAKVLNGVKGSGICGALPRHASALHRGVSVPQPVG